MRTIFLAVACIVFAVADASAVSVADVDPGFAAMNPEAASGIVAEKILREKNEDYGAAARQRLRAKHELFDLARVEVTGVISSDDTYLFDQKYFAAQIKPSFTADEKHGAWNKIKDWAGRLSDADAKRDLAEMRVAMRGEMTERARQTFAAYKDKDINELVAHSWGTEAVYAAILNGELRPPKKLIVVGVPDNNLEKWELLSRFTGTEVHYVRATNDAVAEEGSKLEKKAAADVDFTPHWDRWLREHGGQTRDPSFPGVTREPVGHLPGFTGHGRQEYYGLMKKDHILDRTVLELNQAMAQKVEDTANDLRKDAFESALVEARSLVTQARIQAEIASASRVRAVEPARALPYTPGSPAISGSTAMPRLKDFAIEACRAPERVDIDAHLVSVLNYKPYAPNAEDDRLVGQLMPEMEACPRQLFYQMYLLVREGSVGTINREWLRSKVASFLPGTSSGNVAPPRSGDKTPPRSPDHDPVWGRIGPIIGR